MVFSLLLLPGNIQKIRKILVAICAYKHLKCAKCFAFIFRYHYEKKKLGIIKNTERSLAEIHQSGRTQQGDIFIVRDKNLQTLNGLRVNEVAETFVHAVFKKFKSLGHRTANNDGLWVIGIQDDLHCRPKMVSEFPPLSQRLLLTPPCRMIGLLSGSLAKCFEKIAAGVILDVLVLIGQQTDFPCPTVIAEVQLFLNDNP